MYMSGCLHTYTLIHMDYTGEQKKIFFLVPWFLGLFLGLFGALIQKNALDGPHQL